MATKGQPTGMMAEIASRTGMSGEELETTVTEMLALLPTDRPADAADLERVIDALDARGGRAAKIASRLRGKLPLVRGPLGAVTRSLVNKEIAKLRKELGAQH